MALSGSASLQSLGLWRRSRFVPRSDPQLLTGAARLELASRYGDGTEQGCRQLTGCADASLRVDATGISELGAEGADWDGRIERFALGWTGRRWRVRVGDHHLAVGHGLSLSLRRIDTLGVDTALRGGRLEWHSDWHQLTLAAGVINTQNLDPILLRLQPDPDDRLAAVELLLIPIESLRVGPYLVASQQRRIDADGSDRNAVHTGVAGELAMAEWRLRADGAIAPVMDDDEALSWAAYLGLDGQLDAWTALLELKSYRAWSLGRPERLLAYHEPPSLERDDQEVPSSRDAVGGRLRVGWQVVRPFSLHANLLAYGYSLDGSPAWQGQTAIHGYLGGEWRPGSRSSVAASAGLRQELERDASSRLRLWHLDLDLAHQAHPWLSLSAKVNHRNETKTLLLDDKQFVRGLAVLGAAWPGIGALSLLYGYSTESLVKPVGYPAVELRALLPAGGEARLFAGRLAGGRICVSGSCRDLPPFEGLRLDLLLRL